MIHSQNGKRREIAVYLTFLGGVFLCLMLFFTKINPIVIFDTDDWLYISYTRAAIPLFGEWNPSRILPEVLMGACSSFGVFAVKPIVGDYVNAISLVHAFTVSGFVIFYLHRFVRLIRSRFGLSCLSGILSAALFLLCHFWALRYTDSGNYYLLYAHNATCYFYYVIPNLLNAGLVMYFLEKGRYGFGDYPSKVTLAAIIIGVYFAVFSNLFPSIILVALFGWEILSFFIKGIRNKTVFKNLNSILLPIIGVLLWVASLIFEMNGGRASSTKLSGGKFDLVLTVKNLAYVARHQTNRVFIAFVLLILIASAVAFLLKKERFKQLVPMLLTIVFCLFITTLYLLLLSAKVKTDYIQRPDVLFCIFFYLFLLLFTLLSLFMKNKVVTSVFPLLLIIIFSLTVTRPRTFAESNTVGIESSKCKQIDRAIIARIMAADAAGERQIMLRVPVFGTEDNYPLADYGVQRISDTLYQHRVIHNRIKVIYCPDEQMNRDFGLTVPQKNQ